MEEAVPLVGRGAAAPPRAPERGRVIVRWVGVREDLAGEEGDGSGILRLVATATGGEDGGRQWVRVRCTTPVCLLFKVCHAWAVQTEPSPIFFF